MHEYVWRNRSNYTLIDINTTGLSRSEDKITEIVLLKVKNNVIIDKLHEILTDDMYYCPSTRSKYYIFDKNNKTVIDLYNRMAKFIKKDILVGWCIDFDVEFLEYKLQSELLCDFVDIFDKWHKLVKDRLIVCSLQNVYEWNFETSSKHVEYNFENCIDKCLATKQLYDSWRKVAHDEYEFKKIIKKLRDGEL